MSVTDKFSDLLQMDAEDIHETAKKGLWLSLFTGLFGLVISGISLLILVTTVLSLGGDDAAFISWVASKGIVLIATLLLIVPMVRSLRWISKRVNRSTSYAWAATDPILAALWVIIGLFGIGFAISSLETQPNVDSPLGIAFRMGYYFVFAGIGTASAMAWLFAGTTLVVYLRHLHIDSILSRLTNTLDFLWSWTFYPKLYYRYAKVNRMTLGGVLFSLLRHGSSQIKTELETVEPVESETTPEAEGDAATESADEA